MTTIIHPTEPNGATPSNWPKRTPEQIALYERLKAEQGVQPRTLEEMLGAGSDLWKSDEDFEDFMEAIGRPIRKR